MTVEARDMEGTGLLATVPLVIRILDVNDETPSFDNNQYHFTLSSDLRNFSTQAFVKVGNSRKCHTNEWYGRIYGTYICPHPAHSWK